MERRPMQKPIRFRMATKGPPHPPSRQQRQINVERGRYGSSNRYDNDPRSDRVRAEYSSGGGVGGGGGRRIAPTTFVRNPKHPKSLYDVELSMRKVSKGKPAKLTPGLSFPDPKAYRPISNPTAPRLHFEFEPSPDDYNIVRNPITGTDGHGDPMESWEVSRYINTNYDNSSDGSDDNDGDVAIQDEEDTQVNDGDSEEYVDEYTTAIIQAQEDELALYSQVNKMRAHRVREAQFVDAKPPAFEPQPPPPRAPVDPVLVIPRAVVREEEAHREHRHQAKNENTSDDNNNVIN